MSYTKGFTLFTAILLTAGCGGGSSSSPAVPVANNTPDTPPVSETPLPTQPVPPLSCERDSWVAGTVELCDGALIYRDYIYDDYGADTGLLGISPSNGIDLVNLLSRGADSAASKQPLLVCSPQRPATSATRPAWKIQRTWPN